MMEFAEAWDELAVGLRVRVSNGRPEPAGSLALKIWKSHNFEGEVVQLIAGPARAIRVQLDPLEGAQISYTITEASGDRFELI